ncbi:MAG: protein kinase [Polyangiaceae bacterium]
MSNASGPKSDDKAPAAADASAASPVAPKRAFSRPVTPTTPFMPGNPVHDALMKQAEQRKVDLAAQSQRPQSQQAQQAQRAPTPGPFPVQPLPALPTQQPSGYGTPPAYSPQQLQQRQQPQPASTLHGYAPAPPITQQPAHPQHYGNVGVRGDLGHGAQHVRPAAAHVVRSRSYAFMLDARGLPVEVGSGRFGKAFLGEERWLESKTDFRRQVVIKVLQKGVDAEELMRFQMEKELLERVQGHPNIVKLFASGEGDDANEFLPPQIRDKVESEFVVLEKLEMSLEERLKGSRLGGEKEDLLQLSMQERIFRVLDYVIPIASAIEYAHLIRNISHRDIKPANILIALPDPNLRGSALEVRLADFNVAKVQDSEVSMGMTRLKSVPGTLFFQSPEQETNTLELLVNVQQGSPEVEFFEDFYIQIAKNDSFSLFNRTEQYPILSADRTKKRLVLGRPYREPSEHNVRAKIQKSVGRPADIYSLGALLYYLISGAYANPKTLYDHFHKFIEYERAEETNTIEGYLEHEYSVINSIRAPKAPDTGAELAPADRFFTYKHFLDGNGELIDPNVMRIIAKCMIRNKPDSYCQAHDVDTRGISDLVGDLIALYTTFGVHPSARPPQLSRMGGSGSGKSGQGGALTRFTNRLRWFFQSLFRKKK